jgi:A/G-specific adenine glycosylase
MTKWKGILPSSEYQLIKFSGIGKSTASAISVFAFNSPAIFIETNIRRVFLHFFFQGSNRVRDTEILKLIEKTLDVSNVRHWYYALMDYGAMLKKTDASLNKKSAHYQKQTPFHGSNRQIRGKILKKLVEKPGLSEQEIVVHVGSQPEQISNNLKLLTGEGFLKKRGKRYSIA